MLLFLFLFFLLIDLQSFLHAKSIINFLNEPLLAGTSVDLFLSREHDIIFGGVQFVLCAIGKPSSRLIKISVITCTAD